MRITAECNRVLISHDLKIMPQRSGELINTWID
jgi:hypothetical protein